MTCSSLHSPSLVNKDCYWWWQLHNLANGAQFNNFRCLSVRLEHQSLASFLSVTFFYKAKLRCVCGVQYPNVSSNNKNAVGSMDMGILLLLSSIADSFNTENVLFVLPCPFCHLNGELAPLCFRDCLFERCAKAMGYRLARSKWVFINLALSGWVNSVKQSIRHPMCINRSM